MTRIGLLPNGRHLATNGALGLNESMDAPRNGDQGAPALLEHVWKGLLGPVTRHALDLLFPPQCLRCRVPTDAAGTLCPTCWQGITFITHPQCAACGLPFPYDLGNGVLCGACVGQRPAFERARAVMIYDDASRDLLLAFKYADRTDAAPAYGAWLARAGGELLAEAELTVPVPLHWTRLFGRRYNQAQLLARAVGRISGCAVAPNLLRRQRKTPPQGRLTPAQRRANLVGAFAVGRRAAASIRDKRVLLVDDVLTTGATASACARTLLRAGAGAVDVLTLARVVRAAPPRGQAAEDGLTES